MDHTTESLRECYLFVYSQVVPQVRVYKFQINSEGIGIPNMTLVA